MCKQCNESYKIALDRAVKREQHWAKANNKKYADDDRSFRGICVCDCGERHECWWPLGNYYKIRRKQVLELQRQAIVYMSKEQKERFIERVIGRTLERY